MKRCILNNDDRQQDFYYYCKNDDEEPVMDLLVLSDKFEQDFSKLEVFAASSVDRAEGVVCLLAGT